MIRYGFDLGDGPIRSDTTEETRGPGPRIGPRACPKDSREVRPLLRTASNPLDLDVAELFDREIKV